MFYQENQNENCFSRVDTVLNIETRSWSKYKDTKTLWRKAQAGAEATLHHGGVPRSARLHLCGISLGQPTPCWADNTNVSAHCVCVRVCVCESERDDVCECVGVWTCNWPRETETERQRGREAEFNQSYEQRVLHAQPCHFTLCIQYSVFQWQVSSCGRANDSIWDHHEENCSAWPVFVDATHKDKLPLCTAVGCVCVCVCVCI